MMDWITWVFFVWMAYIMLGLQRRIEKLEAELQRKGDSRT